MLPSVLALLAFACFSFAAPAVGSEFPEYEDAPPEVPEPKKKPPKDTETEDETPAKSSNTGEGTGNGGSGGGPGGSSGDGSSEGAGSNPSTGGDGNGAKDGKGKDSTKAAVGGVEEGKAVSSPSEADDSSSSPLVPILIAIAILAAISIGAVVIKQRRSGDGGEVSPKAS